MTGELLGDQELVGEVVAVIYRDRDSGFGVVEVADRDGEGHRCAGPLSELVDGQPVRLMGRRRDHPRYGETFEAVFYEQVTPATLAGVRDFLASDRFAEVPDGVRERVLATFGAATGRVLDDEPHRLEREADLEPVEADALRRAWQEGRALGELVRLVEPAGWPLEVARAVHAQHGADAPAVAAERPYDLLEVDRVRFAHVDALGRRLGVPADDPARLAAGATAAVLTARRAQGHQHLPEARVLDDTARLLGVDALLARHGLDGAVAAGTLRREEVGGAEVVTTPGAARTEQRLAEAIAALAQAHSRVAGALRDQEVADELTAGQRAAVERALAAPVSVLTGGPGTGKTRTVQEIVAAAGAGDLEVALCAPTGRAAKRLEEMVGRPATTVHRLLEARPVEGEGFVFRRGEDDPLPHDVVVVDELSMCDTWLAGRLVAAVEPGAHLVLVGDADQLPSVGPGEVLRDLVDSGLVPATTLTEIHRQAAGSRVVGLARDLLAGDVGELSAVDGDLFLAEERRREAIVPRVVEAVARRAPDYFDVGVDDVQVLAPTYKGPAGVDALNAALKDELNPAGGRRAVSGLHEGDRVMQTRNDPELDVANGDVGNVVDLDPRKGRLRVGFPRGEVTYERDDARHLTPAWAVTVHKAQGGEWPVVVLVVDGSHGHMLDRRLIYTAVTRARRALIVVGQAAALRQAARTDRAVRRHTGLAERLAAAMGRSAAPEPEPGVEAAGQPG